MSLNLNSIHSQFNFNVASDSERIVYVFEKYRVDKSRRMLYRGVQELALPPKAIETLIALIELRGEIVAKDDLMKTIWADTVVEESNLTHHIHVLRKTLGQKSNGHPFIETFRRRGYRFTSEVRMIRAKATYGNGHSVAPTEFDASRSADRENSDGLNYAVQSSPPQPVRIRYAFRYAPPVAIAAALAVLVLFGTFRYIQWPNHITPRPPFGGGDVSVTPLTNGTAALDVTISADGKYFVYHEQAEDKVHLWLQQTGQPGRIEIVPPAERGISGKTFSPNGEFVYFVGREKGDARYSLYRVPTFGGPLTRILTDIASPVSFSPDGREIVFARYNEKTKESHLVTAASGGGNERILLTRSGREGLSVGNAWSPDGKFIAYGAVDSTSPSGEGTCSMAAVEVETRVIKALSPERWDTCFRMAWMADGSGVVFIGTRIAESYTTRRDQVYYLSIAEGRSRRISTEGSRHQATSLGVTADNSLLVVPSKRLSQVWVMNADGDARTAVQLTNGQADGHAGIAPLPDGRIGYISRVGENLSIWIMNADGTNQTQISDHLPFVEELRATPDGRFFVFSARRDGFSHLFRIDTDGQNLKQLTRGESHEIDSTISPDSRWVYYGSNVFDGHHWKTYLRKTAIDDNRTIDLKEMDSHVVPYVSLDGRSIAAATGGGIKILSSSDGALLDSLETDKHADLQAGAKWTPDGQSLTYLVYRDNSNNVWAQSVSGSAPRPLTHFPKGYVYFHAFSHDGTRLYVARGYQIRDAVLIKSS